MARPVILVSNDDGVQSEGVRALAAALRPLGRVFTVAPEVEQSATSHAISLARPLRLRRLAADRFAVDGTPVDCVYIAVHHKNLLPARPALVVSGINHGLNLGSDVFYSGTVAAAREGAMRGIPSIAFSLSRSGSLETAMRIACQLASALLRTPTGTSRTAVLLNVNIPRGRVRGIRATRLGTRLYDDLVEVRVDPRGAEYLWIGGPTRSHPVEPGTDTSAHADGFTSVTPLTMELFEQRHYSLAEALVEATRAGAKRSPRSRASRRTP